MKTNQASVKTVVLAEDHHVVRHSLRIFLEAQADCRILGEASNGIDALQMVEALKPDLFIIDLFMPGLNGLEVLRKLKKSSADTRTIILSMHSEEFYVIEALKHGAAAYVLKQSTAESLVEAIREVSAGRRYLSPPLSERAIEVYVRKWGVETGGKGLSMLTLRESEVLGLVAKGQTNAEIGKQLHISPRTVEHHRASLMRKLKCKNQAELIRHALRNSGWEVEA